MARRTAVAAVALSFGLALSLLPVAASAASHVAASNNAPTPPKVGTWKIYDSQDITSGTLTVYKQHGHLRVKAIHGVLSSFYTSYGCPADPFTVEGSYLIRKTKVSKTQKEWAVSKGWGSQVAMGFKPITVPIKYDGKTVHGALQITFANKSYKPVVDSFSFGSGLSITNMSVRGCDLDAGLKRK